MNNDDSSNSGSQSPESDTEQQWLDDLTESFANVLSGEPENDDQEVTAGTLLRSSMIQSRKGRPYKSVRARSTFTCELDGQEQETSSVRYEIENEDEEEDPLSLCRDCFRLVTECTDSLDAAMEGTDEARGKMVIENIRLPSDNNRTITCTIDRGQELHDLSHGNACAREYCETAGLNDSVSENDDDEMEE